TPETEYTITFYGGDHGSIVGEAKTKTVNGKISGFPDVDADAGWLLDNDGWTLEDGKTLVGLDFDFKEDTDVYAHYVVDPVTEAAAVAVINGKNTVMTDNTESISAVAKEHGQDLEYIIQGLTLTQGATIAFQVRNEAGVLTPLEFYLEGDSRGVDVSVTDTEISSATTLNDGTFQIVLKHNTKDIDGSDKLSWSVSINDGSPAPVFEDGLYVVGNMTNWRLDNAYMLVEGSLEKRFNAGDKIKICGCVDGVQHWGDWPTDVGVYQFSWWDLDDDSKAKTYIECATDDDNKVVLTQEAVYTITVTGKKWSVTMEGEPTPTPTPDPVTERNIYLKGDMNDWGNTNKLTEIDPDSKVPSMTEQYTVSFTTTAANVEFKLWEDDGTEDGAWITVNQAFVGETELTIAENGNVAIPTAGTYTAYVKVYNDGTWLRIDLVKTGGEEEPDPSGEINLTVDCYIAGNFNGWGDAVNDAANKFPTNGEITLDLNKDAIFKIIKNGT
ncbi:MAG: hypothetical protein K2N74_03805, partial [Clostridiales bacterium]|nr:hypothetical protein [Clostridiales bacterium]